MTGTTTTTTRRPRRDREADTALAASAVRVPSAVFRNMGSKDNPAWVVLAPLDDVTRDAIGAGAAIVRTSKGEDSYVAIVGLHEHEGSKTWPMVPRVTSDGIATDLPAVQMVGMVTEHLNLARDKRDGITYVFPETASKVTKLPAADPDMRRRELIAELKALGVEAPNTAPAEAPADADAAPITSKGKDAPTPRKATSATRKATSKAAPVVQAPAATEATTLGSLLDALG